MSLSYSPRSWSTETARMLREMGFRVRMLPASGNVSDKVTRTPGLPAIDAWTGIGPRARIWVELPDTAEAHAQVCELLMQRHFHSTTFWAPR